MMKSFCCHTDKRTTRNFVDLSAWFFNPCEIHFFRMLLLVCGLIIPLHGCASKASNPLQQPERFAEIYTKVLIANEVEADFGSPQARDARARSARADSVLRSLGVDRQQFEAAAKYFGEHPERWQEVYTHVVKILEAQANADKRDEHRLTDQAPVQ
jgi:hypothetical protein